jgi:hypothetical protein
MRKTKYKFRTLSFLCFCDKNIFNTRNKKIKITQLNDRIEK